MVRYRDGDAAGEGKLDDYACYILALLELYRVTFRTDYLKRRGPPGRRPCCNSSLTGNGAASI